MIHGTVIVIAVYKKIKRINKDNKFTIVVNVINVEIDYNTC